MNIEVINLTEGKAEVSKVNSDYIVNFGRIDKSFDASVSLLLIPENGQKLSKSVFSSCGCTTPDLQDKDGNYVLNIKYNNQSFGTFTKTVKVSSLDNKKSQVFKIKGETNR